MIDQLKHAAEVIQRTATGAYGTVTLVPEGFKIALKHDAGSAAEVVVSFEDFEATNGRALDAMIALLDQRVTPEFLQ